MTRKTTKIAALALILVMVVSLAAFAKSKKSDEKRFQLGFGANISTNNILGLIENVQMAEALEGGSIPSGSPYEGLDSLNKAMQQSIMVANILGGMEYAFQFRLLWHVLMVEADLVLLPFNGSYNGRFDLNLNMYAGVRAPFWIMPYFIAGPMFTFSFYPDDFKAVEEWKSNYGGFKQFLFRPGLNMRLGLDFKFKHFSIGAYYQYSIKDFEEYGRWFADLVTELESQSYTDAQTRAAGMIFGAQSRFGASIAWYIF
jgi:hypothetical protein